MNTHSTARTRDHLLADIQRGFMPSWLFFWGHTPTKDGSITKTCFSQWWAGHPFDHEGATYATAEHFMMAEKARLFGDEKNRHLILESRRPDEAKKLGRRVRDFDDAIWTQQRWSIVVQGNISKFSQHPALRRFLLETGENIIVEASPYDRIWGIGMAVGGESAPDPATWKGLNLLGFALMEVRDRLRREA